MAWRAPGHPTASQFHRILTPTTRKFSKQSQRYAFALVAEKLLNMSLGGLDYIEHVQRGKDLEPDAVSHVHGLDGSANGARWLSDDR